MARQLIAAFAVIAAALSGSSAWAAQTVQQKLSQLANASPDATRLGLRSRGYALAASDAAGERAWQYWWNGRDIACVVLATTGARVDKLATSSESDCNQLGVDPARMSNDGKVAAAAAKLLGVNTLMHKTHQRDASRYKDYKGVANFEQGYRDGVNKAPFRERERERNNVAYADGFKVGQAKVQAAPPIVAAPGLSGAALPPPSRPRDLVGRNASEIESGMKSLGYTRRSEFNSGQDAYSTWQGPIPSLCVRAMVRGRVILSMDDLAESICLSGRSDR
jgi:hypothetical protein